MNNEEKILTVLERQGAILEDLSATVGTLAVKVGKLEQGQAKLEQGQAKLEQGQAKLEQGQAKLEQSQAKLEQGQVAMQTDITEIKERVILMEQDNKKDHGAFYDGYVFLDRRTKEIQDSVNKLHERQDKHELHILRLDAKHEFTG